MNNMLDYDRIEDIQKYLNPFHEFQNLMRYRIREILLVSSLYDSFILEEDGRLYEKIHSEYHDLNLSQAPGLTRVSNGRRALKMAAEGNFDLIITTMNLGDMHAVELAREIVRSGLNIPVVLLTYDNRDLTELINNYGLKDFERVFIWQGDFRILVAIIKSIEDHMNVEPDTERVGVQSLILIEDNVHFYSSFLPIIYNELFRHSQSLISEAINVAHKLLRMRARPKILLCNTYEEAMDYYTKYESCVLGVISDIEFPRNGEIDPEAGIKVVRKIKESHFDIPILLQSDTDRYKDTIQELGAAYLLKTSPRLLRKLREFMVESLCFGDFVFRMPDGREIDRATDLRSLEDKLHTVPDESISMHASRNHFSNWLKARTEFWLAHSLRPQKISDFKTIAELRDHLIKAIRDLRQRRHEATISDFNIKDQQEISPTFVRIGGGSLGGKARGLAFANTLITNFKIKRKFSGVKIFVPTTAVLGTDVFDQFLDENNLRDFALESDNDQEIIEMFLEGEFPEAIQAELSLLLETMTYPIAVRSSSLLEDSRYLPFAGVYDTFMLSNNSPDKNIRLGQLINSIKQIYASTFCHHARSYIKATSYRLEEEKMAIVIQRLIGSNHDSYYYPDFAGVVRSHNFYPRPPMKPADGIASVGLGLGKTVIDGGQVVRFCPRFPRHQNQYASNEEALDFSQKHFYAIKMDDPSQSVEVTSESGLVKLELSDSEKHGTLNYVGSTYSHQNDTITDGLSRPGIRMVSFAPILKNKLFPLPEILDTIMSLGNWGMSSPVEIEFAVNMSPPPGKPREFAFLQIRPLIKSQEVDELEIENVSEDKLLCQSPQVLGNGILDEIKDIVMVDQKKFDRAKSKQVAEEVGKFNVKLAGKGIPYLLIGVGRWGSSDPWLGIPVTWDEIYGARVIIEAGFKHFKVVPSQGTHFFQNITSFMVGYFTVNSYSNEGFVDWEWLRKQKTVEEMEFTSHIRLKKPLTVKMNGHYSQGIIIKPD